MVQQDPFSRLALALAAAQEVEHGAGASEADLAELRGLFAPLPADFVTYIRHYGWLRIGSFEFFGLGPDVPTYLHLVERCRALRAGQLGWPLPPELLCFYDSGASWLYCFWAAPSGPVKLVTVEPDVATGEGVITDTDFATWSELVMDLTRLSA
jgi:hypothetical protein